MTASPYACQGHILILTHKLDELKSDRLTALKDTMLQSQTIMLTEKDEVSLMQKMVDVLVTNYGYVLVWIGIPVQNEVKEIKPVAMAGTAIAYLDDITVHWSEDNYSQGTAGMAINTEEIQVLQIMAGSPGFLPWQEAAAKAGFKGCITLPLFDRDKVIAALMVYSTIENSFDEAEISLLTEFSNSLGFAIQSLRIEIEKENFRTGLNRASMDAINAIAATIEKRDPYTTGHQDRVVILAVEIALILGWDQSRIEGLRLGATIHDIGKIYVPAEILNRPGKLTHGELEIIKTHPQVGYDILEHTHFPWPIREMIYQHHERLDGSGYPLGLKGGQIIDEAKVIAIADVVEAVTSHRPYRPGNDIEVALDIIQKGRDEQFDPRMVDICVKLFREQGFNWT
jgi:HD-GYP domain-containing protein (c-di-GMP phosphodiesterase class II)